LAIPHLVPTATQQGLSIHGIIAEDTDVAAFGENFVEFIFDLYLFHVLDVGLGAFSRAHHADEAEILGDTTLCGLKILFIERMDQVQHEFFCLIFNRMCFHGLLGYRRNFCAPGLVQTEEGDRCRRSRGVLEHSNVTLPQ
jgi:hypothetical protein